MNKGDYIYTPRFCNVRIEEVFENRDEVRENGYTEQTHYRGDYDVLGKSIGVNRMVFAAVKKQEVNYMSEENVEKLIAMLKEEAYVPSDYWGVSDTKVVNLENVLGLIEQLRNYK